jgi:hypothetical protein
MICVEGKLEMALAFDSLDYTKRLEAAGVPRQQAEAHAEAFREFIMPALVTKQDLPVTKQDLAHALDRMRLTLLIQLGGLWLAGMAVLAVLIKLN